MSKSVKRIILSICLILVGISMFVFLKPISKVAENSLTTVEHVEKIKYGEVYVYEKGKTPSYIKFIDNGQYVAMPLVKMENDYDYGPTLRFIEGNYQKRNGVYYLGKKVKMSTILFSTMDDYEERAYSGAPRIDYDLDNRFIPFSNTSIQKKEGVYWYRWEVGEWKEGDEENPSEIRSGETKLEKADEKLPNSIEEFLSKYHQKEEN